jgi:hypothetical protein
VYSLYACGPLTFHANLGLLPNLPRLSTWSISICTEKDTPAAIYLVVTPSCNCATLVVFTTRAERNIVRAPLTGGASMECSQHNVYDALRCKYITSTDGRSPRWRQKAATGNSNCHKVNENDGVWEKHLPSRGTRQPAFRGMSTSSIERMQYITAEWTTEIGELRLPRTSHPVPSKSNTAEPSSSFISTRRQICNFHRRVSNFCRRIFWKSTCRRAIVQIVDRAQDIGI